MPRLLALCLAFALPAQEKTIPVKVLDAQGKPAVGVPLRAGWPKWWYAGKQVRATDKQGIGRITVPTTPQEPFFVRAGVETRRPAATRIEAAEIAWRKAPVEIRLPPTGSVDIAIVDAEGKPRFKVKKLLLSAPGGHVAPRRPSQPRPQGGTFAHVGLQCGPLRLTYELEGVVGFGTATIAGPKRAGEVKKLRIPAAHLHRVVIENEKGTPFADRHVWVSLLRDRHEPTRTPLAVVPATPEPLPAFWQRTDQHGRIAFFLRPELFRGDERATFVVTTWRQKGYASTPGLLGRKRFRGRAPDLRRLRLHRMPVAAAGCVVDDRGRPLSGATVLLSGGPRTLTDANGRFELRGMPGAEHPRVTVQMRGFLRTSRVAIHGDTRVRVKLRRAAMCRGRFARKRPRTIRNFGIELIGKAKHAHHGVLSLVRDREIRGESIPPGTYDVAFRYHRTTVHVVRNVKMVAGQVNQDPRLQDIPWERIFVNRRVRVVDHERRPIHGCRVTHWRIQDDECIVRGAEGRTNIDGDVWLWMPKGEPHILIATPDGRILQRNDIRKDATVVVGPARRLTLALDGIPALPKGFWVEACWRFVAADRAEDPWELRSFDLTKTSGSSQVRAGAAQLTLPGTIPLHVELRLRHGTALQSEILGGMSRPLAPYAKKAQFVWSAQAFAKARARLEARLKR